MSTTTMSARNTVKQWDNRFLTEWTRAFQFYDVTGEGSNNIVVTKKMQGQKGNTLTIPVLHKLAGSGVTGSQVLMGNEEALDDYGHVLTTTYHRHAVRFDREEMKKSPFELRDAAREALMNWFIEDQRDRMIDALCSPNIDGKTPYASCTETQKDAWLAANSDRIIFGAASAGFTDHSVDLALLDTTADTISATIIDAAKTAAKTASPKIRPYRIDGRNEMFVLCVGTKQMASLRADTKILAAHQYAASRGMNNPLFQADDIMYGGILIREIPEMPVLDNVGDSGTTDVGIAVLLGAQAVGWGWGSMFRTVLHQGSSADYDFFTGVAGEASYGIEKLSPSDSDSDADPVQHGVVTLYTAVA